MRRACLWVVVFAVALAFASCSRKSSGLLDQLDRTIAESRRYVDARQAQLDSLKACMSVATTDEARYRLAGTLREMYTPFNADTALYFANEKMEIARRIGNMSYIHDARMNVAEVIGSQGMYKESLDYMGDVDKSLLDVYQIEYYYHVYRFLYGLMADNRVNAATRREYTRLTDAYRDSLLMVNPKGSFNHVIVQADKYNAMRRYDLAIKLLNEAYRRFTGTHERALVYYSLAEAYSGKGDTANEKKYLAMSAVSDIKSGIREYSSLRKLAVILYNEGDVDHAYAYMTRCMNDAAACNSLWRIYEVQKAFPVINKSYHMKLERQRRFIMFSLVSIILLSLFLVVAVLLIKKHARRATAARLQVQQANARLKELNAELSESSLIKEEYIAHYIDRCSLYIESMDNYRKHLQKIAAKGGAKELFSELRSTEIIDTELKDFYTHFDDSFLKLFPTFVEDFNSLLRPEARIRLKPGEKLNTELRIFALVRLGISSSTKIAHFLRYSVTTIYNYRVKLRNGAEGDRDKFDEAVMRIGRSGESIK